MLKVIAGGNVISGILRNFEMVGEDLVVRLQLSDVRNVEVSFPNVPTSIIEGMKRLGAAKLKNATVDFNRATIELQEKIIPAQTNKKVVEKRPGMRVLKGGIVG